MTSSSETLLSVEARRSVRVSLDYAAQLVTRTGTVLCRIDNMSAKGALLTPQKELELGDYALLQCDILDMLVEVIRHEVDAIAGRFLEDLDGRDLGDDPAAQARASTNRRFFRLTVASAKHKG